MKPSILLVDAEPAIGALVINALGTTTDLVRCDPDEAPRLARDVDAIVVTLTEASLDALGILATLPDPNTATVVLCAEDSEDLEVVAVDRGAHEVLSGHEITLSRIAHVVDVARVRACGAAALRADNQAQRNAAVGVVATAVCEALAPAIQSLVVAFQDPVRSADLGRAAVATLTDMVDDLSATRSRVA